MSDDRVVWFEHGYEGDLDAFIVKLQEVRAQHPNKHLVFTQRCGENYDGEAYPGSMQISVKASVCRSSSIAGGGAE